MRDAASTSTLAASPLGLYVHVPFCRSKCVYCDFCSHPPAPGEMDRCVSALQAEIRLRTSDRPAQTIYFGGGTPSFIGAPRLSAILQSLRDAFPVQPDCEITVEANPCDITTEWLTACRSMGVNRLSIGAQSTRDEDLRFLGRAHTVADAVESARRARAAGFDNIGIDLIVGLPGHTPADTREMLTRAVAEFAPEHLSCYQLTCAPGTRLYDSVQGGDVRMPDADIEAAIFMTTHETLAQLGYEGYEVSNFARTPALRSRHNSAYWAHRDYLGFGPAAHSFLLSGSLQSRHSDAAVAADESLLAPGPAFADGPSALSLQGRAAETCHSERSEESLLAADSRPARRDECSNAVRESTGPVRSWNTRSLPQYCASLERDELSVEDQERLTDAQLAAEIILLGLRTVDGLSLNKLRACGFDLLAEKGPILSNAESDGLLHRSGDRIQPTLKGLALADHLALALSPDALTE